MLQFRNLTRFAGTIAVMPDPAGVDSVFAILKGTFTLADRPVISEEQVPIALADEFRGDPGKSSLKVAADLCLIKPGTDILLHGQAYARAASSEPVLVSLQVGGLPKQVRVFGDRHWDSGLFGPRISVPQPFETMALHWERAFGGADETSGKPSSVEIHSLNPVGVGYRSTKSGKKLEGLKLPNLEIPSRPIKSWRDHPAPANFAAIAAAWEPRKSRAGTYDNAWAAARAPYLPKDFDPRFLQVAPSDQVAEGYLKGGEPLTVQGASQSGTIRSELPRIRVGVTFVLDGQEQPRSANLDTVIIEPDAARLILVWRSVLPCDKKTLRVREIIARADPF